MCPRIDPQDKTFPGIRGTTPELRAAARALRATMTPAERVLWEALKEWRRDGITFRRQHPVGPFVLDFYCPAAKLALEVDGAIHNTQRDHDEARTQYLSNYGYRLLRVTNTSVLTALPAVLARIQAEVTSRPQDKDS